MNPNLKYKLSGLCTFYTKIGISNFYFVLGDNRFYFFFVKVRTKRVHNWKMLNVTELSTKTKKGN